MSDGAGSRAIPRRLLVSVGVYLLAYVCWQLLKSGQSHSTKVTGDLAFVPLTIVAILSAWRAANRAGERRSRSAWRLLAVALGSYCLGNVLQVVYEWDGSLPSPSLADPFWLAFYPLFFAALLRLPVLPATRSANIRILLDTLTVTVGGGCVIWYVVLGPTATQVTGTLLQRLVASAYPASDLMLVAALAHLVLRADRTARATIGLLAAGVSLYLFADVMYSRMALNGAYSGGDWVDTLWMIAAALFALAAASQPRARAVEQQRQPSGATGRQVAIGGATPTARDLNLARAWPVLALPYIAVGVVLALLIGSEAHHSFFPDMSLTLTTAVVCMLVVLRELLAHRELSTIHAELLQAHRQLGALATTDALTELPNHRALVDAIDREVERSGRYMHTCALMFIDLDHFKALNDTRGHAAGDAALTTISARMRVALRAIDTMGRWGGEEFVAVLPESDADSAMAAAERVRRNVAEHPLTAAGQAHMTVSIGVSLFPRDGATRDELLTAADTAMYTAKRLGRNQSVSAADPIIAALEASTDELSEADEQVMLAAVNALAALGDTRDEELSSHNDRIASLAQQVALALGCDAEQARRVYLATRVHDIGKVAIADSILRKPGRLTPEEWRLMRSHPVIGARVIERMGSLASLSEVVRSHHEHFDGSGYPDGLKGPEIPLEARIVGVADAYDAMLSDRPYRASLKPEEARAELDHGAGTQFDPDVVAALERVLAQPQQAERIRGADNPAAADNDLHAISLSDRNQSVSVAAPIVTAGGPECTTSSVSGPSTTSSTSSAPASTDKEGV